MKTVYFLVSGSMIICQTSEDTYTLAVWGDGISRSWDTSFDTFDDACKFKHTLERKHGFKHLSIESMQIVWNPVPEDESQYGMNR